MTAVPQTVSTGKAPAAVGPYSQAVEHGGILYCSETLPLDPATGEAVAGGVGAQTAQCLVNLEEICRAAGTSLAQSLRLTIYTTQLGRFAEINHAYAAALGQARPARATVEVVALPRDAMVEIDAIVAVG